MNGSQPRDDAKAFESKVAGLIAATRTLDVPRILMLRRITLADPEARRWATEKQLGVVFSVILTKAAERLGADALRAARDKGFDPLLPPGAPPQRDEDRRLLADIVTQIAGPPPMSEAESAQASFAALLERVPASPPPRRVERAMPPLREPPPLFAAQLGPGLERRLATARVMAQLAPLDESGEALASRADFVTLFDDTVCAYVQKTLAMFRVSGPSHGIRLPFLLSPEFGQAYREVLRRFVLPQMRATRHMQALAQTYNWSEVGAEKIVEIIQGSEVNNPILHNWDARWAAFRPPKPLKGRKAAPLRPEDDPWPLFRQDATRFNYQPPGEDHLVLLQDVIRFEADVLAKCWRELSQLYAQEFAPTGRQEQAREGALRDGMMKWVTKLPEGVGEHMAIKALFEFEKLDPSWLRRLLASFGRNESERRRAAPVLSDFVMHLGGA